MYSHTINEVSRQLHGNFPLNAANSTIRAILKQQNQENPSDLEELKGIIESKIHGSHRPKEEKETLKEAVHTVT